MKIENNRVVTIHYTLKDGEDQVLDSSAGRDPLAYIHGIGALIPGLEKQMDGRAAGEKFQAVVQPADGYGEYDEEQVFDIPSGEFDPDDQLELGMQIQLNTDSGSAVATIVDIKDDFVTLDLNHPMAGVTLFFDVEIMDVREATANELSHGHVHGPGGHHH